MADNKRIFYALQQVEIASNTSATPASINYTTLKGVQSVGLSSTTNIESFSAFGSTAATSILQDLDLEVTLENGLGDGWQNSLYGLGVVSDVWDFSTFNFDTPRSVRLTYKVSDSEIQTITLNTILASYSVQMGTDGPATESVTFNNAGTAVFASTSAAAGSLPAQANAALCDVITRPNFTSFETTKYDDCCATSTNAPSDYSNVISFSAGFDLSNEKVSVLGQSLPIGKFSSFPSETSAEIETHVDPSGSIGSLNSGNITGNSLDDACYDIAIKMPGNEFGMDSMRWAGTSRSGGDVGGGNVTVSDSYTGYNTFVYTYDDGTA
jgi:hypothetical protein